MGHFVSTPIHPLDVNRSDDANQCRPNLTKVIVAKSVVQCFPLAYRVLSIGLATQSVQFRSHVFKSVLDREIAVPELRKQDCLTSCSTKRLDVDVGIINQYAL